MLDAKLRADAEYAALRMDERQLEAVAQSEEKLAAQKSKYALLVAEKAASVAANQSEVAALQSQLDANSMSTGFLRQELEQICDERTEVLAQGALKQTAIETLEIEISDSESAR